MLCTHQIWRVPKPTLDSFRSIQNSLTILITYNTPSKMIPSVPLVNKCEHISHSVLSAFWAFTTASSGTPKAERSSSSPDTCLSDLWPRSPHCAVEMWLGNQLKDAESEGTVQQNNLKKLPNLQTTTLDPVQTQG